MLRLEGYCWFFAQLSYFYTNTGLVALLRVQKIEILNKNNMASKIITTYKDMNYKSIESFPLFFTFNLLAFFVPQLLWICEFRTFHSSLSYFTSLIFFAYKLGCWVFWLLFNLRNIINGILYVIVRCMSTISFVISVCWFNAAYVNSIFYCF